MLETDLHPHLNRRTCLKLAAALGTYSIVPACSLLNSEPDADYSLVIEPHPTTVLPNTLTPTWTFNRENPAPILRVKQNRPVKIRVTNHLTEATTIHWHGLRIENSADGVPFLTQPPIQPGESFLYEFTCPDAGTFWYHPHMNSLEQLSRGLVGLIIVEEEAPVSFAAELALILKDWHLNDDGSFKSFSDPRAAARTGTLGNVATVNGQITGSDNAKFGLPAGQWSRVRIANVDNTRVYTIASDHPAVVLAVEGNPLADPVPLHKHPIGAGMRVDLAIQMPENIGAKVFIQDMKGRFGFNLCELLAVAPTDEKVTELPKLPRNPITQINKQKARRIPLVFEWAGALSPGYKSASQTAGDTISMSEFWTINKRAWEGASNQNLPAPLAEIKLGEHIIFELYNATPHHHPIHLHGYTFTVLSSDQKAFAPYHTDTVLMQKYERMEVAIVADNPGNWMFHCHVIEHMKTGLMGYIKVA